MFLLLAAAIAGGRIAGEEPTPAHAASRSERAAHPSAPHEAKKSRTAVKEDDTWSVYGGNLAGQHYSKLNQINTANVGKLTEVWRAHTGSMKQPIKVVWAEAFEDNPVIWQRTLYVSSPLNQVVAIEARTGQVEWRFDPHVDLKVNAVMMTSRGIALWHSDPAEASRPARKNAKNKSAQPTPCADRVFLATIDARLIAIDAHNGSVCTGFGANGAIDLTKDVHLHPGDGYAVTSAPTVIGNVVVVGSSIGDNRLVEEEMGIVRGFDAVTGRQIWSFDPIPWARHQHPRTGGGNAWSSISADVEHGLVYIPTGSASPDFYGKYRIGDDRDADSVVAVEAATGRKVWAFQTVHHDLWDYDVAAEPMLFTFRGAGAGRDGIPAVAVTTKTGMVFILNRLTGQPLFPVEERPVAQSTVPGEQTSPTQPFSSLPSLINLKLNADTITANTPEDQAFCREKVNALVNDGIFTPISVKSTLLYPGSIGGVNWGSPSIDPRTNIMVVNVNQLGYIMRLIPRDLTWSQRIVRKWHKLTNTPEAYTPAEVRFRAPDSPADEISQQAQTPYMVSRVPFLDQHSLPCAPQPWGHVVAMDLNAGKILWDRPAGTLVPGKMTGSITLGGPMVTAGGLAFTAATAEPMFRAYDESSGKLLWESKLPVPAQATPMTYEIDGRQYIIICSGGHGSVGLDRDDAVVAYALPEAGSRHAGASHHRK
jgi:quinoprotein glucose dehydrogenase